MDRLWWQSAFYWPGEIQITHIHDGTFWKQYKPLTTIDNNDIITEEGGQHEKVASVINALLNRGMS